MNPWTTHAAEYGFILKRVTGIAENGGYNMTLFTIILFTLG